MSDTGKIILNESEWHCRHTYQREGKLEEILARDGQE